MSVGSNIFAVDGTSYRKGASGKLVFGTMTLPPGSEITPSGHVIPVGSSSAVVDGTSYTWAAPASSPTSTPASENIGGLIMSAFGKSAAANSSSSPLAYTGGASSSLVLLRPGLPTTMMVTYNVLLSFLNIQAGMMLHINLLALFEDLFLIDL